MPKKIQRVKTTKTPKPTETYEPDLVITFMGKTTVIPFSALSSKVQKKLCEEKENHDKKPKPVCLYCKEESTFDEHTTECEKCGRYQDLYGEFSESD